jgi:hypothetical protein
MVGVGVAGGRGGLAGSRCRCRSRSGLEEMDGIRGADLTKGVRLVGRTEDGASVGSVSVAIGDVVRLELKAAAELWISLQYRGGCGRITWAGFPT